MKKLIIAASCKAESELETELKNELAHTVIREEAVDFRVYVEALTLSDLAQIEPLPYRRVLSREESEEFWNGLKKTWSIGDGYWFPLKEGPAPRMFWLFTPNILSASTARTSSDMRWKDAVSQPSCCFTSLAIQITKLN
jgi:hypothetical protein